MKSPAAGWACCIVLSYVRERHARSTTAGDAQPEIVKWVSENSSEILVNMCIRS